MGDTYIEEMVARKASVIPTVLKVVLGAVGVGSLILGMMGAGLFYSIALFAGLGIFSLVRRANKEVSDVKLQDLK